MRGASWIPAALAAGWLWGQARDVRVEPIRVNQRVALVMGNAVYKEAALANPGNDAAAIAGALRRLGFEVTEVRDAGLREMSQAIDAFAERLQRGDLGVFYFAGHGVQVNLENYLVPVDFSATSEADVPYTAYSTSRVRDKMEKSGARVRVIILDACRNNPFRATRGGGRGLAAMQTDAEGTLIAFATGDNNVADDNPRESNSLFTKHLVAAMETPGLSHDEIFRRVKEGVYYDSGRRQNPFTYDNIVGRLVLKGGAAPPPATAAVATPAPAPAAPGGNEAAGLAGANELYARRDWQGALAGYRAAESRGVAGWFLEYRIGMCELMMNRPAEAAPYLERSYRRRARPVTAFFLGGAMLGGQRQREALGWYRRALELTVRGGAGADPRTWAPGEPDALAPALLPELYRLLADLGAATRGWDEGLAAAMQSGLASITDPAGQEKARNELARVNAGLGRAAEAAGSAGQKVRLGMLLESGVEGLRVMGVDAGLPAEQAGIRPGDALTVMNGISLAGMTMAEFTQSVIPRLRFGEGVLVTVLRNGQTFAVRMTAGTWAGASPTPPLFPEPVLEIRELRLYSPMPAGAPFLIGVEYVVSDPAAPGQTLAAELSYSLLSGNQVVFAGHPLPAPAVSGQVRRVEQQIGGVQVRGVYTVRVTLHYRGMTRDLAGQVVVQ